MTQEEKRVAIAKACGWKFGGPGDALRNPKGQLVNAHYSESWRLPDYFNDLNAMHEAMDTLPSDGTWDRFVTHLKRLCRWHVGSPTVAVMLVINASASNRAEAFGLTLKLWDAE